MHMKETSCSRGRGTPKTWLANGLASYHIDTQILQLFVMSPVSSLQQNLHFSAMPLLLPISSPQYIQLLPSGLPCEPVLDATSQTYIIPPALLCGPQYEGCLEPYKGFKGALANSCT